MKRSTEWLVLLLFFALVCATEYILQSVYHIRYSDPIHRWVRICVTATFWLGFMLYLWRSDIAEFLKRVLIAIPFALLFAVFMIMVTGTLACSIFALLVYLLLLYKTPSWKQHFSVVLVLASILTITLKFSYAVLYPLIPQEMSSYWWLFPAVSIVFIGFFYGLYMRKVKDGETVDLRAILIRMCKFIVVFSLYSAAYVTLQELGERYRISLPINLIVSGVLTIIFLAIVYLFDLMPFERKKTKKKSKLGELQSQLNDVCLEEYEKLKGKN